MAPAGSKRGTSDRGDSSSDEGAARSAKGTRRPGHARDGEQRRKKQYERRERVNGPTEPIGADDADQGLVPKYPNRAAQPGGNCAGPVPDGAAENKEQQQLQKITKLVEKATKLLQISERIQSLRYGIPPRHQNRLPPFWKQTTTWP